MVPAPEYLHSWSCRSGVQRKQNSLALVQALWLGGILMRHISHLLMLPDSHAIHMSMTPASSGHREEAASPVLRQQRRQRLETTGLTIHIVIMRFVVLRHRQQHASWICLGQRPASVVISIALDKRYWNAAIFVYNYEGFTVASFALCPPKLAILWLSSRQQQRQVKIVPKIMTT